MNENIENVIETEAIPEADAIRVVVENGHGLGRAKKVAIGAAVITTLGGIAYAIIKALNKPAAEQIESIEIDNADCDEEADDDAEDDEDEDDSEEETE